MHTRLTKYKCTKCNAYTGCEVEEELDHLTEDEFLEEEYGLCYQHRQQARPVTDAAWKRELGHVCLGIFIGITGMLCMLMVFGWPG